MKSVGLALFLIIIGLGCLNSSPPALSPNSNSSSNAVDNSTALVVPPAPILVFCDHSDLKQNETCFNNALKDCSPSVGRFWETPDGFPLVVEVLGVTPEKKCEVRVTAAPGTESTFASKTADCLLPLSSSSTDSGNGVYDIVSINSTNCTGEYSSQLKTQTP